MSLSNDSLEGRLVKSAIQAVATRDGLDLTRQEQIARMLDSVLGRIDGLGFCLSEHGDLLSQWRGYGDDGRGVSIGFNSEYLSDVGVWHLERGVDSFGLHQVAYDSAAQEALVQDAYTKFKLGMETRDLILGALDPEMEPGAMSSGSVNAALIGLLKRFFVLKAPSFAEEREWRLLSIWLHPLLKQVQFRSDRGRVIPYRTFELPLSDISQIPELVVGPKNDTPLVVIDRLLAQAGFLGAAVRRSTSTYR